MSPRTRIHLIIYSETVVAIFSGHINALFTHTFEGAGVQMWLMYRVGGKWRLIVYKLYISVVYKPRVLSWNTAFWRCYHKLISLQSCLFSSTLTERAVLVSLFHSVPDQVFDFLPIFCLFFYWSFVEGCFDILYLCSHFLVSRGVAIIDWGGGGRGILSWMLRKGCWGIRMN